MNKVDVSCIYSKEEPYMGIKETMTNVRNANKNKAELDKATKRNKLVTGGLIGLGIGYIVQCVMLHKTKNKLYITRTSDNKLDKLKNDLESTERKFYELISDNKEAVNKKFNKMKETFADVDNDDDYIEISDITVDDVLAEEAEDDN